jgi:hypothetical protein
MATRRLIPSNQTRGFRRVQTIAITQDNAQATVDLPRGPHIEAAVLRVGGTINNSVAFVGAVRNLAPHQFIRRMDWVLNSNVTMDSISGTQAAQHLQITRRTAMPATSPLQAIGPTSFEATVILDRSAIDAMRPKDSYLKTDVGISNNQLRLQFGAISDMFGAGAGTSAYTNVTATIHVVDYQEARDAGGNTPAPIYYQKRNGQRVTLNSAGNGQQVKINTGNRLRYISMRVLDATTGEPNIALISGLRLKRAGDTRVDVQVTDLLRINAASYGAALLTGQIVIDLAYIGALNGVAFSEFWPIPSSADTFMEVDTTAACILDMTTLEGVDMVTA